MAHCILRLIESDRIADRKRRIELLDSVYQAAPRCTYPFRRVLAVRNPIDRPSLFLAVAMSAELDQLSVQTRATRLMLAVDPNRAWEMFREIRFTLPKQSCSDSWVPDVAPYYDLAADIFNRTLTARERARGDHVEAARMMLARIQSPVEIAPAARMIVAMKATQRELLDMISALSLKLTELRGDDRSFSYSTRRIDVAVREKIASRLESDEANWRVLRRAYRSYLVRHFTAARCAESVELRSENVKREQALVAAFQGEETFSEKERSPDRIEDAIRVIPAPGYESELLSHGRSLFPDEISREEQQASTKSQEWLERWDDLIRKLENLQPSAGQSDSDVSGTRLRLLLALCSTAGSGIERDRVRAKLIDYLAVSPLQESSWPEWLSYFTALKDHTGAAEREKVFRTLTTSRNPDLALLAQLELLCPKKDD